MTGLPPSTRIYYVVGDATLGWSRQFSFLTAPSSSTAAGSPGSTVRPSPKLSRLPLPLLLCHARGMHNTRIAAGARWLRPARSCRRPAFVLQCTAPLL